MNRPLVVLVTILHLLPHPFGVTPVGALALYAGASGASRRAWLVPLVPLFIGDLLGGFYDVTVMLFVYTGFALAAVVGRLVLARGQSAARFATAIPAAAVCFYVVSNFSIWLVGMYPPTAAGLVSCYVNGLPYLATAMLADAVYCLLLFGAHRVLERRQSAAVPV